MKLIRNNGEIFGKRTSLCYKLRHVFLCIMLLPGISCKKKTVNKNTNCDVVNNRFEKTFGGENEDLGNAILIIEDFLFLLGTTQSKGEPNGDLYLVKIDLNGNLIWEKTYGGEKEEFGFDMAQTTDNHIFLTGYTESYGKGKKDAYLVKINTNGDLVWEKTFGGMEDDLIENVQVSESTEDILLLGTTESKGMGLRDMYFLRLDKQGSLISEKTYGGTERDGGSAMVLNDDNLLLFGYTESFGSKISRDYYLIKTNLNGDTIFTKTFGGNGYEESQAMLKTEDGGYIINGHSSSIDPLHNMYAIKLDNNTNIVWEKHFGGEKHDGGHAITRDENGNFIFMGRSDSFGNGGQDIYLVKASSEGAEIGYHIVGGDAYDRGNKILMHKGYFYLIGETASLGSGGNDMYCVKFKF